MISPRKVLAAIALLAGIIGPSRVAGQAPIGVIHTIDVPAPSLRGNLLGDPDHRLASIYLPADYARQPGRRFAVIYLLHGFGAGDRAYIAGTYQNLNVRVSMDSLIAAGAVKPMIVVTPNARNRFDGSFYVNTPTTGRWEDFITRDLVRYMDRHFRTIPRASARGLAGHSMGGYGAFYIGMRHPDIFSAVYAMSPCCLGTDLETEPGMRQSWLKTAALADTSQIKAAGFTSNLLMALSAVYSPDPRRPPFYLDLPFRMRNDSLVADTVVAARWRTPLDQLDRYRSNLARLQIGFDAGRQDGFADIPSNADSLDRRLTAMGIRHRSEIYEGTHGSRIRERLETVVFPFFSSRLR